MSGLVGAAQFVSIDRRSDTRINRMDFQPIAVFADVWCIAVSPFTNGWWPRGGGLLGDQALDGPMLEAVKWGQYDQAAGASSRYGFVGVSRDAYGAPVPSCIVRLYRTSDGLLIDQTTSDSVTGAFLLNTAYYPDQHFITAHLTASGIAGATPDTMVGT